MAEINFLNNKNTKDQKKAQPKKTDNVLWSKVATNSQATNKKNVFGWFNFVDKNKNIKKINNDLTDKLKIKHSREEVLKLIKQNEKKSLPIKQKHEHKLNKSSILNIRFNPVKFASQLFNRVKPIFNKKVQKNIQIDYQQVFNKEKKISIKPAKIVLPEAKIEAIIKKVDLPKIKSVEKVEPITEVKIETVPEPVVIKKQETATVKPRGIAFGSIQQDKVEEVGTKTISEPVVTKKQETATIKPIGIAFGSIKQEKSKPLSEVEEVKQWKNPDIMKTNLIKGEIVTYFDWKSKIVVLINVIILSCSAVGLVYGGLLFWQKQSAGDKEALVKKNIILEEQTNQAEKDIKEIAIFQNKLKAVSALLNDHIYWTNFFKFLEDNTIADVYYSGFSGGTNGKYSLGATTKNYAGISRQINTMRANSNVVNANAGGGKIAGQGETSGVSFSLDLEINPDIFIK